MPHVINFCIKPTCLTPGSKRKTLPWVSEVNNGMIFYQQIPEFLGTIRVPATIKHSALPSLAGIQWIQERLTF